MKRLASFARDPLYRKQHGFYKNAYKTGHTPWSSDGAPAGPLARGIKKIGRAFRRGRALDLGCGEGRHTRFLAGRGFSVIGVEYQREALDRAVVHGGENRIFVRGDIFRPPFKEGVFDVVLDYGVFHHIRRRDSAPYVEFLARLLVAGGYLFLSCFSRDYRHADGRRYPRGFVAHRGHYDRFSTLAELRKAFGKYFKVEETVKNREGFFHLRLKRLGPSGDGI